ncbi:PREDICTED: defensin [Drosophila arizonae]|uniref:Defensin n=1 Tax=Drosophila arizonae TaxID=7263 RepID=A0ABM1PDY0_DROAR|nr:PREDICTED: defensin [Drosophila arizonae]
MKFIVYLGVLLAVVVYFAQAQPLPQDSLDEREPGAVEPTQQESHSRLKRATCDLLSGFSVNHSACAVHCIGLGKSGGYCNDKAVCVCRR